MSMPDPLTPLADTLAQERERWVLWVPVALLAGISGYFALPFEPWPFAGLAITAAFLLLALLPYRTLGVRLFFLAIMFCGVGFALVQWEAARSDGPILRSEVGPRMVSGIIRVVEPRDKGIRITLDDVVIDRLETNVTPRRVRITVRTHGGIEPIPGQRVRILAMLDAPPPPTYPGGFDFAREAYFDSIGGVGFAVGPLERAEDDTPEVSWLRSFLLAVERTRLAATDQILETLPEPTGGVAAALLTGHRSAVPSEQLETIRMAGLAHLLAISGLHLGLVTAIFFFVIRGFLATLEPVALRFPIKTWAALGALVGAFGYLLISGMTVPTQRAFLMTAIVLIAVAIGRQAISLRLVALAAVAVMVISPHVVTGASFQLSFAAVIGLVAVYEALKDRWPRWRVAQGPFSRIVLYVGGVALTTLVANFATAPLVLAQFGRFATYGLFANLIAVPVTAFWIMPWGLLSLILMPMGLEGLALVPMGWGIDLVLIVAEEAAHAPYSQVHVSAAPFWVPAVFGLGLVWLCIWRSRWRALGFAPILLALIVTFLARPPDVLVHGDADLVAVRISDEEVAFSALRRGKFVRESWLGAMAEPAAVGWPVNGLALGGNTLRCDSLGCIYRPPDAPETTVAIEQGVAALDDDCGVADLIISMVPIRRECSASLGTIDRFDLWRYGTHALWFGADGVRIETVRGARGERTWSPGPESDDE